MRLFISYARVDKRYCEQIIDLLDSHNIWYDQRLHMGQKWWQEIVRQLTNCEGLVYLLSPESIQSEYCHREYTIAKNLGKHIFPVVIHPRVQLPPELQELQHADLSNGLDGRAVKTLLNAIYLAERQTTAVHSNGNAQALVDQYVQNKEENPNFLLESAAEAIDNQNYDQAVFLLKQLKDLGFKSRFIDLPQMLEDAEVALERQAYMREAEREYGAILALVRRTHTRSSGLQAFRAFSAEFPDYDPENIGELLKPATVIVKNHTSNLHSEWCDIPEGKVTITDHDYVQTVLPFKMSKYPVTNAQFQVFIDDPEGYANIQWWKFSPEAFHWHCERPAPLESPVGDHHPRINVCWYEAVAYCRWISYQTGLAIKLPTEEQWQWAAQGAEALEFPWGDTFDPRKCNTKESRNRMPVPVDTYPHGASPFGVVDMAGNVWEWCSTCYENPMPDSVEKESLRVVRGGSFMTPQHKASNLAFFTLKPIYRYTSIGFRVICEKSESSQLRRR